MRAAGDAQKGANIIIRNKMALYKNNLCVMFLKIYISIQLLQIQG